MVYPRRVRKISKLVLYKCLQDLSCLISQVLRPTSVTFRPTLKVRKYSNGRTRAGRPIASKKDMLYFANKTGISAREG
jgi:hypothetical protein